MAKEKRKPKIYTPEQIDKLRYTIRKPDTASAIRNDLYGPRHVTYETKLQRERRHARNANHGAGDNAQGSSGGSGGHEGIGGGGGHGGQTGHRVRRFRAGNMSSPR